MLIGAIIAGLIFGLYFTLVGLGLNLVFGRYTGKTAPGLNVNWPWPIGSNERPRNKSCCSKCR